MLLPYEIPRCEGHGAGPSGHQIRMDCLNCLRRTAPRPAGMVSYVLPEKEFPCPNRIPEVSE